MRTLLLVVFLAACARQSAPAADDAMPTAEKDRGMQLCAGYVRRVCACAETDPSLRETCALSKGQPSAVRMHLEVLGGAPLARVGANGEVASEQAPAPRGPLNDGERRLTEASLRKVIAACVKLDAELDPTQCPRVP